MKAIINEHFIPDISTRIMRCSTDSMLIEFGKEGGRISLFGDSGSLGGVEWRETDYFVFDTISYSKWITGITLQFWQKENTVSEPDMTIVMGVLPGIKTRLSLSLSTLDSQKMFLHRTPGKLKTVIGGSINGKIDRIFNQIRRSKNLLQVK